MSLDKFLQVLSLINQYLPMGQTIGMAAAELFRIVGSVAHPVTTQPMTEAEVLIAAEAARSVWSRIVTSTAPRT